MTDNNTCPEERETEREIANMVEYDYWTLLMESRIIQPA